mmetsp:Transcript_10882/g.21023  ORF Transcript_10882/g.21023 Transcript_10882/m.21023 type:complete len:94 (+) Transcript_10882:862-1143(+)
MEAALISRSSAILLLASVRDIVSMFRREFTLDKLAETLRKPEAEEPCKGMRLPVLESELLNLGTRRVTALWLLEGDTPATGLPVPGFCMMKCD